MIPSNDPVAPRRPAGTRFGWLLAAALCAIAPCAAAAQAAAAASLQQLSGAFEALAGRVSPAVVEILVAGYGPEGEEDENSGAPIGRQSSQGSGVIVAPDGYIITNYHVVAGAQRVRVVITPPENRGSQASAELRNHPRILPAKVLGASRVADLAVLKVDATDLPTIPFANYRRLRQGQVVLAVGSPIGLKNSVSLGLVSSVLRQTSPGNPMVYIQTDAAINPGNSGGALVDVDGNLVGINSSILTQSGGNEGIGFAIPGSIAQFIYQQIRRFGYVRNGYIGANIQAITPTLAAGLRLPQSALDGVIVSDVAPDSPAARAGLQIYDRIDSMDGQPVTSVPAFAMNILLRRNGDRVRLGVVRGDRRLSLEVPVIEIKPGPTSLADFADPATDALPQLGVVGANLTAALAGFLPPPRIDSGVVVAAVLTGARAADLGLAQGDIIHAVNAHPVADLPALRAALRAVRAGDPVVLEVEQGGRMTLLSFDAD